LLASTCLEVEEETVRLINIYSLRVKDKESCVMQPDFFKDAGEKQLDFIILKISSILNFGAIKIQQYMPICLLNAMTKAKYDGQFSGDGLSILQYTDDTILFLDHDLDQYTELLDAIQINIDLDFFWQGNKDKKKYRLDKWNILCRPKDQGGLGIADLATKNIILWAMAIFSLIQPFKEQYPCPYNITHYPHETTLSHGTYVATVNLHVVYVIERVLFLLGFLLDMDGNIIIGFRNSEITPASPPRRRSSVARKLKDEVLLASKNLTKLLRKEWTFQLDLHAHASSTAQHNPPRI
ncbi:hypothetical protein ACJX0J_027595, partial [Zea mays]